MVCLIDADMQQRPELVLDMMAIDKDPNYDAVACYQEDRRESKKFSRLFKDCFYKIINKTSEIEFKSGASDFRLLRRCVVDAVLSMSEYHRFSKGIFSWVDSTHIICPISLKTAQTALQSGTLRSSFKYAMDGIIAFTTTPLKIATYIGLTSSAASIIYMIVVIIQKLAFDIKVPGYATNRCASFFCSAVFSFLHRHGRRVSCQNILRQSTDRYISQEKFLITRTNNKHTTAADIYRSHVFFCNAYCTSFLKNY